MPLKETSERQLEHKEAAGACLIASRMSSSEVLLARLTGDETPGSTGNTLKRLEEPSSMGMPLQVPPGEPESSGLPRSACCHQQPATDERKRTEG